MQAFLRAANGARENTGVLKAYLELIRDLAYDIEDSLEEFMVFIKHKSLLQQLLSLRARHRIAVQIRTLKLKSPGGEPEEHTVQLDQAHTFHLQ